MKSSSSIQISKQQTEMLPIQLDSVQGSVDIDENETMEISDVTESHENLEKLVQSRKELSAVLGKVEATSFSPEKIQTILDECIEKRVSPTVLALKYNVGVSTIRYWITKSGRCLQLGRLGIFQKGEVFRPFLVDMSNFKSIDGYKDISPDMLDFNGLTENDRQMIIEDCTEKLISPSVLELKYKVKAKYIRDLVTDSGRQLSSSYEVNLANYSRKMPWLLPYADQERIKAILDECVDKKISPSVLALKHSVNVKHIKSWARSYDRKLPDDYEIDLSNFNIW
jgi:ribosomal protein S25